MSLLVERSFAAFGGSCAPDIRYDREGLQHVYTTVVRHSFGSSCAPGFMMRVIPQFPTSREGLQHV